MVRRSDLYICSLFIILSACSRSDLAPFEVGSARNIIPVSPRGEIIVGPHCASETFVPVEEAPKKSTYEKPISVVEQPNTFDDLDEIEKVPQEKEKKKDEVKKNAEPMKVKKKVVKSVEGGSSKVRKEGKILGRGQVISKFGEVVDGYKNDGIYVKATLGDPVTSFKDGEVIYSGSELQDYGNIVVVKHNDDLISTYAHLQKINVKKGDKVIAGADVIGFVGKSGNVKSPQLYFQLMKNSTPVDPLKFIEL